MAGAFDWLFGSEEPQQAGATWLQNPQYSFTEPRMKLISDYITQGMQSMQEGKPPTWFQNYEPIERKKRMGSLYQQYYGGPNAYGQNTFGPGILETQQAADVAAGRRGGGAGSNYAKQLANYSGTAQAIDDYLSQMGSQAMESAEGRYLQYGTQMPEGPKGQWQTYEATPYQQSPFETIMGAALPLIGTAIAPGIGTMIGAGANQLMSLMQPRTSAAWNTSGTPQGSTSFGYQYPF